MTLRHLTISNCMGDGSGCRPAQTRGAPLAARGVRVDNCTLRSPGRRSQAPRVAGTPEPTARGSGFRLWSTLDDHDVRGTGRDTDGSRRSRHNQVVLLVPEPGRGCGPPRRARGRPDSADPVTPRRFRRIDLRRITDRLVPCSDPLMIGDDLPIAQVGWPRGEIPRRRPT